MSLYVYSVLTGGYEAPPLNPPAGADAAILFTDDPDARTAWDVVPMPTVVRDPLFASRHTKALGPYLMGADVTVYLDANIELLVPVPELVDAWLSDGAEVAHFAHSYRNTIRQEAEECEALGKLTPHERRFLFERCGDYLDRPNLASCGVLVRRKTSLVIGAALRWWSLISSHSWRDQLTFPIAHEYARANAVPGNVRSHKWFRYTPH